MSGAAAVICPKQDCSFFSQLLWPHSSLTVLLLAGSCSNINCSSLLSRPSLFVIPCSLPRCCFLCPLGSLCLCVCAFFSFFKKFFTMSAVVSGFWTQCDHEVLWGHLVSCSRLLCWGSYEVGSWWAAPGVDTVAHCSLYTLVRLSGCRSIVVPLQSRVGFQAV